MRTTCNKGPWLELNHGHCSCVACSVSIQLPGHLNHDSSKGDLNKAATVTHLFSEIAASKLFEKHISENMRRLTVTV